MERIIFNNVADFIESEFSEQLEEVEIVSIVAKYNEAKEVIKSIIECFDVEIKGIDISTPEYNEYNKEYIITIVNDEHCLILDCEPMWRENKWHIGYLDDKSDISYIFDSCSSKVLKHIDSEDIYEVGLYDDEDDDFECHCCNCHCESEDELKFPRGITYDDKTGLYTYEYSSEHFEKHSSYGHGCACVISSTDLNELIALKKLFTN